MYNSSVGIDSTLTCDFNGTDLEQFVLDVITQSVTLDSLFIEFQCNGVTSEYTLGCPDPIEVPWSYSASATCTNPYFNVVGSTSQEITAGCYDYFSGGGSGGLYFYAYRGCETCAWNIESGAGGGVNNPPASVTPK